jgi:ribonuclease J
VRPRWFIPIHGERRHLQHHARLAVEVGIPSDHVIIAEDGDVVEVGERVKVVDRVQAGMTFVDGLGIGDVGGSVLRDRRKLAGDGVVVVVLTVDGQTGEVIAGPDIVNRGFVYDETSGDILEEARNASCFPRRERGRAGYRSVRAPAERPARVGEVLLRGHPAQAGHLPGIMEV